MTKQNVLDLLDIVSHAIATHASEESQLADLTQQLAALKARDEDLQSDDLQQKIDAVLAQAAAATPQPFGPPSPPQPSQASPDSSAAEQPENQPTAAAPDAGL